MITKRNALVPALGGALLVLSLGGALLFGQGFGQDAESNKVDICHIDDQGNIHLISVNENAVPAHVNHGDFYGTRGLCGFGDASISVEDCIDNSDDCDRHDTPISVSVLATFKPVGTPAPFNREWPEGISVLPSTNGGPGSPLVALGRWVKIAPDGSYTDYATLLSPPIAATQRTVCSVVDAEGEIGPAGNTYLCLGDFQDNPAARTGRQPGIYVVPQGGGEGVPFSLPSNIQIPEMITIVDHKLWVADSIGAIYTVDSTGAVSLWSNDPLLAGNVPGAPRVCPVVQVTPHVFGAMGVLHDRKERNVYVSNFDRGSLVKIHVKRDGTAGRAVKVFEDCQYQGIKGLALNEADGSIFAVGQFTDTLYRIDPKEGSIAPFGPSGKPPYDSPSYPLVEKYGNGHRRLLVTNFARTSFVANNNPLNNLSVVTLPDDCRDHDHDHGHAHGHGH
jgi:hypothetical protein